MSTNEEWHEENGWSNGKYATHVQWKGTDLCMDFLCPACGEQSHFDGLFAYHIQCPNSACGARFRMPTALPIMQVDKDDDQMTLYTDEEE